MNNPNELNSFTLRASFQDSDGNDIIFTAPADTELSDQTTTGQVKVFVSLDNDAATIEYAETNDGSNDITLDGLNCYALTTNGKYAYYPVRGGLPDGDYKAVIQLIKTSSGLFDPRLSTKELQFSVVDQKPTFA